MHSHIKNFMDELQVEVKLNEMHSIPTSKYGTNV